MAKTFATQQDLQKAEAQLVKPTWAIQQQAASNVQQAQLNLSYTQVKAPFDGVATARLVSIGELVIASTTALTTVVQLNPIYVNFNVQ